MKNTKSRNSFLLKISSTGINPNSFYTKYTSHRTDVLNQYTSNDSTNSELKRNLKVGIPKENSIINRRIKIHQNFTDSTTLLSRPNYNEQNSMLTTLSSTRSSKRMFPKHSFKKSLEYNHYQPRFKIKIDKNFGKPSNDLVKFNDKIFKSSRCNSYKVLDTNRRIFDTSTSLNSTHITNHRSFRYPHSESKMGDLLSYKYAPVFRIDKKVNLSLNYKLPKSINKNDFDILSKLKKYKWEK